jgi:hypothetical protein
VVQVDLPEVAYRPAPEPGMEIFITDQYGQYIVGDTDRYKRMAFLECVECGLCRECRKWNVRMI